MVLQVLGQEEVISHTGKRRDTKEGGMKQGGSHTLGQLWAENSDPGHKEENERGGV